MWALKLWPFFNRMPRARQGVARHAMDSESGESGGENYFGPEIEVESHGPFYLTSYTKYIQ